MARFRLALALVVALVAAASTAAAQSYLITNQPPYSGAAIGAGYSMANGTLYMPTSASLQAITLPMSYSIDVVPALIGGINQLFVDSQTASPNVGYLLGYNNSTTPDFFHIQAQNRPGYGGSCDQASAGAMCWRNAAITDGKRHNLCVVLTAAHGYFYMDGVLRDETANVGAFTAAATTWSFGLNLQPGATLWDFRHYNRALSQDECVQLSNLQQANLIPNSGSLTLGLVVNLPLNNCVATGVLQTCADASGNSNNATNDKAPPVVTILTPSGSPPFSGTQSVTASCTDPAGLTCTKVCYEMDGYALSATCPTTAPYTYSWDTTKLVDGGSHTLTAVGYNFVGITGTGSKAVTASNGVTASTYQFDSVNGNDGGSCLAGTPCKSFAKLQTLILKGGDTVGLLHDDTFTLTAAYTLCAGSSGCGTQNFFPSNLPLTFTTYGGGSCNPFTLTATGCATIAISGIANAVNLINPGNIVWENTAIFGSGTAATTFCNPSGTSANGIGLNVVSTFVAADITIQNNWVRDWSCNIVANESQPSGTVTNIVIEDNVSSGSTNTAHVDQAIRIGANTQGTIQNNLAFNIGGTPGASQGNGIVVLNYPNAGSNPTIVQFNVVHDFGTNNTTCGGPVGIYATNANLATIQFNESYRGYPASYPTISPAICDNDGFDIDAGATNITEQYNYAHDNPVEAGFAINVIRGTANGWANNTIRYNIAENNGACFAGGGNGVPVTNSYTYNNTCVSNVVAFAGTASVCWGQFADVVFANNLCIYTGTTAGTQYVSVITPTTGQFLNNDFYSPSASPIWRAGPLFAGINYSTLSAYQTATGFEAGSLNVDPQLSGTPGTGGTCYTSGIPAGPQSCPSTYILNSGSPMIGVGLDLTQAPYSLSIGTRDYYGTTIPNGVGTGYNIGADGAHH